MKKFLLLFAMLIGGSLAAHAQGAIKYPISDPTGTACGGYDFALYQGKLFACTAGLFVVMPVTPSGNANFVLYPSASPNGNVCSATNNIDPLAQVFAGVVYTCQTGTYQAVAGAGGGGNVSNSGTPTASQLGLWVDATHLKGVTATQDCSVSSTGVFTCLKTNNVAFAASATSDTTNANNIISGTLNNLRLPSAISVTTVTATGAVQGSSFIGTAGGGAANSWQCAEGTDPGTEASLLDLIWCSSSTHRAMVSNNNGTSGQIALSTDTLAFFGAGLLATGTTAATGSANAGGTNVGTQAYADAVIAKPKLVGNSSDNTVRISGSNFTSSSASQTAITGLAWTLPANTAANYIYDCTIWYNEATSATILTWSVNDVTTAPTSMNGQSANFATTASVVERVFIGTTTTGSTTVSSTAPGAAATNLSLYIHGEVEQPSGSASVFQVEVGVTGGTNVLTVNRGSYCSLKVAAN